MPNKSSVFGSKHFRIWNIWNLKIGTAGFKDFYDDPDLQKDIAKILANVSGEFKGSKPDPFAVEKVFEVSKTTSNLFQYQ